MSPQSCFLHNVNKEMRNNTWLTIEQNTWYCKQLPVGNNTKIVIIIVEFQPQDMSRHTPAQSSPN
jgi:hypothetical protein